MAVNEENIDQFCLITGSERELAKNLLEACGDNLEMAVNMHMENGLGPPQAAASDSSGSGPRPGPVDPGPGSSGGSAALLPDEDGVRAPIPQKQETLVQPGFEGYEMSNRLNRNSRSRVRSVFDGFRNFEEETLRREREDPVEQDVELLPRGYNKSKKRTLEELFKPPLDIMFQGDWQSARDQATNSGRWLLVNIQEPKEFQCQVLNRDLWSNPGVKTIISEHFVFWQQYKQSDEAQRYMTFYKITEWPYIAVIDPRTGENLATWSHIDANAFPELITEFLSIHPSLDTPEKQPPRKKMCTENIAEMDEEAQMAAAIKASLQDTLAKTEDDDDDDDLRYDYSDDEKDSNNPSKPNQSDRLTGERTVDRGEQSSSLHGSHSNGVTRTNGVAASNGESSSELSWEDYLGNKDDPISNILIRYPDGTRDPWNQPSTSKLKALIEFIDYKGFALEDHEIVTNFPRRIISQLDQDGTLKDHGLYPRETVFVQLKD